MKPKPSETVDHSAAQSPRGTEVRRALEAALNAREQAQQQLEASSRECAGAQAIADQHSIALDAATARLQTASVDDALLLEGARRDAQVTMDAATRELDRTKARRDEKQQQLTRSQNDVHKAARAVVEVEVREELLKFRNLLNELCRARESLLGAYLAMPDVIGTNNDSAREWSLLECRSLISLAGLQIGIPLVGRSIFSAADMEEIVPDWKRSRSFVNEQQAQWNARIAQLVRGESGEAVATVDPTDAAHVYKEVMGSEPEPQVAA